MIIMMIIGKLYINNNLYYEGDFKLGSKTR